MLGPIKKQHFHFNVALSFGVISRKIHHFNVRSCYRVSIPSNQAAKIFLLQVTTITKLLGNGIAESVKSCNLHKKGQNSLVLKLENDFK